jgi:hypothetical protein
MTDVVRIFRTPPKTALSGGMAAASAREENV